MQSSIKAFFAFFLSRKKEVVGQSGLEPPTSRLSVVCSSQLSYWPSSTQAPYPSLPPPAKAHSFRCVSSPNQTRFAGLRFGLKLFQGLGGGYRTRTDDPLLAKQVLYQLSYTPASPSPLRVPSKLNNVKPHNSRQV